MLRYPLSCSPAVSSLGKILPQFIYELCDGAVVLLVKTFSGQHNNIQSGELQLMFAIGLANQPLSSVSLHSKADVFLADHHAEPWIYVAGVYGQNK